MGQYLPVVALAVLAVLFAALSRVASQLLAPSATTIAKRSPYECGIVPGREPPERFPVRFYLIAMIFIVFDIEIIFLYPWAVIYRNLGALGLAEVLLFTVAVLGVVRLPAEQRRPRLGPGQAGAAAVADGVAPSAPPAPRSSGWASTGARAPGRRRGGVADAVGRLEGPRGPRPQLRHRQARRPREVGPPHVGDAGHLRPGLLRHRDDGHRRRPLRHLAVRHGDLPGLSPSGRPHDRRGPRRARRWRRCCGRSTTR